MSFHQINGQNIRPGFNSYRFGCGRSSFSARSNMSMNGSIYMPRYGQAPGYVGTYMQGFEPVEPRTSWKDNFWAAMSGLGTALANNAGLIFSFFANRNGGGGDGG